MAQTDLRDKPWFWEFNSIVIDFTQQGAISVLDTT